MRSDKPGILHNRSLLKELATCVSALALCIASAQSVADDTEIFFNTGPQPNVLFMLDISGSMNLVDTPNGESRLTKLKNALTDLLDNNDRFNAGLMAYSMRTTWLMNDINPVADTREELIANINGLRAGGGTPTQRALYEGMRYYQGDTSWSASPPQTFNSPITDQCQSNHIVLLTDGLPNNDPAAFSQISSAIGTTCTPVTFEGGRSFGNCGEELAQYMRDTDHAPFLGQFNNVVTHTIGLNFDESWLADVAVAGGGGAYQADSTAGLLEAFSSILEVAQADGNSFVSPSITVDQFSRLAHRKDTYLALFQPGPRTQWEGNLKRYSFSGDPVVLRDKNGNVALDSSSGAFYDTAHSFWSDTADGGVVAAGGAANELNVANRKVYTYTGRGYKNLNHPWNAVHENNMTHLAPLFGQTPIALAELLKWTRGVDIADADGDGLTNDTRNHIGDPLHSVPTVLNYGGTSANPDSVVFVGTNEGYLHAINSADGSELYSFIPPELLHNLGDFYENSKSSSRTYGLDGDITLWVDDKNNDGSLDPATEHAYLYVGMRRGGNNYYALDVTDKKNPKYLWTIKGGAGGSFAELGQSWSKPTLTTVKMNGAVKDALIFGGGYDPMQDYASIRSSDTIGRSLFMVDATDGSLLWSTAMDTQSDYSKMNYSIPSDPRILDINEDGFVDQIYIGDMGGQVWRFDVKNDGSAAARSVRGGLIASLAGNGIANNRRFFYPPDVAVTAHDNDQYLSISIGSGNRAHPLDLSVDNRFYMIRQPDIFGTPAGYGMVVTKAVGSTPATYRAILEKDLYDATANNVGSSDKQVSLDAEKALSAKQGWILQLQEPGEKVLSSSLTIDNTILFATYIPGQKNPATPCAPSIGGGRAYVVNLFDASPANGSTVADRYQKLDAPGIAGGPTAIILDNGQLQPMVGYEPVAMPVVDLTRRLYWSEQADY